MSYEDDIIVKYQSLKPLRYAFLQSLLLRREVKDDACSDYDLKLVLLPRAKENLDEKLELGFHGVRDLHIGDVGGLVGLMIEIKSLGGHQLEGLRFRVMETENDAISFLCSDVEARITPA